MIHITRKERFNAAHKLYNPNLSDEENFKKFGKCANPNWHGHNYDLYVTVKGEVEQETGYCINLKELSDIIQEHVTEKLDHKNLNLDVPFLKDVMPSTENVAIAIWNELKPHLDKFSCELHCVKLVETENNYVEYYG